MSHPQPINTSTRGSTEPIFPCPWVSKADPFGQQNLIISSSMVPKKGHPPTLTRMVAELIRKGCCERRLGLYVLVVGVRTYGLSFDHKQLNRTALPIKGWRLPCSFVQSICVCTPGMEYTILGVLTLLCRGYYFRSVCSLSVGYSSVTYIPCDTLPFVL